MNDSKKIKLLQELRNKNADTIEQLFLQIEQLKAERDEAVELLKSSFGGYAPPLDVQTFLSTLEKNNA